MASNDAITRYYEANTRRFLRLGGSGDIAAIHRAIWAPGVSNRQDAFRYLNGVVAAAIQPLITDATGPARVLDLGCGVGGTATDLHARLGVEVLGVSISPGQVAHAQARAAALGCADHVRFAIGDFESLGDHGEFDAVCAIESFVHCQNPERFLSTVSQQLISGGRFILCDDFLSPSPSADVNPWVTRFRRGWQINHLLPVAELIERAAAQGLHLVSDSDLSAFVRPFPAPLLWAMRGLTRLPLPGAYWQNLAGGTALQVCLQRGDTQYHAVVFQKA